MLEDIKAAFQLLNKTISEASDKLSTDEMAFEAARKEINSQLNWTYSIFGEQFNCSDDFD